MCMGIRNDKELADSVGAFLKKQERAGTHTNIRKAAKVNVAPRPLSE